MDPLTPERLRAFSAVCEHGGFSAAARALGMRQSSLSEAVIALERELGETLLVRDGRRTYPTPAGEVLRAHAARALAELALAREELAALRAVATGTLRLGVSDTLATYLLPPAFAAFRARHPGVGLALENRPSPALAERVAARALDLAVITLPLPAGLRIEGRPAAERLHLWPLAPHREVVIAPPSHRIARTSRRAGARPRGRRASIALASLAGEPLLLLGKGTSSRAWLDARFAEARLEPHVAMETGSVEVLKRLVELGFGLAIVPELACRREVDEGTLVALSLARMPGDRRVALAAPTTGPLSPAARAFLEVARTTLRAPAG